MPRDGRSKITTDHDKIRKWAEARGGNLASPYQERTAAEDNSNFNRLIGRVTSEAREHGDAHTGRHHPEGR